jgi:hypothetical protein
MGETTHALPAAALPSSVMRKELISSFAIRLRDLLATIETTSLLGAAEIRMRGLGEQLQFACLSVPCDEALVAIELATLGRLRVPGIATRDGWRPVEVDFMPSGTPFAYLLAGGGGFAAELEEGDEMLATLAPALSTSPRHAVFVPIRAGATVLGGAALFSQVAPRGDTELSLAERLAEVLSLTLETHRTERVLLNLFATVLPDLCAPDAPTGFSDGLQRYIHRLRIDPGYQERLALADTIGRIAAQGPSETRLVTDILARVDKYVRELGTGSDGADGGELLDTGELYE